MLMVMPLRLGTTSLTARFSTLSVQSMPRLTERQLQLLELAARGFTNQIIADPLNVSLITVKKQFSDIFVRLDVSNRSEAIALALQRHIIKM